MFRNPFLVARFVLFATLVYLNSLTLIFAALNVVAIKSPGTPAPGAAVFLIFNCCLLFFCLFIGLAELVIPWTRTAMVKLECTWSAILSVIQLSATVTMNVNGPPSMCQPGSLTNWAACATSSVLVPVTWLSSFTIIAYCLTLTITSIIHAHTYPGVWSASVYAVPWFLRSRTVPTTANEPRSSPRLKDPLSDPPISSNLTLDLSKSDIEAAVPVRSSNISLDLISTPWATNHGSRRGVDPPFVTRKNATKSHNEQIQHALEANLRPLPRATRYFDLSWFSLKSHAQLTVTPQTPGDVFSRTIGNEDVPISLPRLSEWIRADAEKGITMHTIPPISP